MGIDYETRPVSRKLIRKFSKIIRNDLKIKNNKISIDEIMDKVYLKYGVTFSYEEANEFDDGVVCYLDFEGEEPCVHIRNDVYENASRGDRKSIGFIIHEICHFYLIKIFKYQPVNLVPFPSRFLPNYKSMEWQAKALCGEVMIPFDQFKDKTIEEILEKTSSSYLQASYFKCVVCLN